MTSTPIIPPITPPTILPETKAYWDAANEHKLLVKRCQDCGQVHFYPRDICPHCASSHTVWEESSGLGTLYSFSVSGKPEAPHVVAMVTLDAGVTMMSNIVGVTADDLAKLKIGQRVKAVFMPASVRPNKDGSMSPAQLVPMFTPVPSSID